MSAILAEGLVREFKEVRAVDGIDLAVAPGDIFDAMYESLPPHLAAQRAEAIGR